MQDEVGLLPAVAFFTQNNALPIREVLQQNPSVRLPRLLLTDSRWEDEDPHLFFNRIVFISILRLLLGFPTKLQ